jgi:hypothetical protein
MTDTNKRLLISESRGDSNRYTPCRGKPNQHDTYASHASPHTPGVRFLRAVPVRGNLSWGTDRFGQIPLHPRKRAPDTIHNTPPFRSVGPYPASLLSQPMKQGRKPSCWRWPTTRFTGPISSARDRYVQYLLAGANCMALNRHRWVIQPWRCRLSTNHSRTFPTSCLPFPLVAPPGLNLTKF